MNAEDKARLDELALRVYALHASYSLDGMDCEFRSRDIEHHGGRKAKAIRLLLANKIITAASTDMDKNELYKVVDMNLARPLAQKPTHSKKWICLESEITRAETSYDLAAVDYEEIDHFSEPEKIYIYFHQDEFDVKVRTQYGEKAKYYYLKECIERRDKFVLKNIIEYELKVNFSKYVNMFAHTDLIQTCEDQTFEFDRYCISTVFEQGDLDEIFKGYKENYEEIAAYQRSLDQTLDWVKKVGGFDEALRIMRKQIISDLLREEVRFKRDDGEPSLNITFLYIRRVKHLLAYETLYVGEEMEGELVKDVGSPVLNMEDGFDEPRDEGSDIEEQAA
jgi:hypothetical protein